jgi:hypothetical protein
MVPTLFFYQLGLVALMYVFLMLCSLGPTHAATRRQPIAPSKPPRHKRSKEPKPFTGLTQRPYCARCEQDVAHPPTPPPTPPEPMPPSHRRSKITLDAAAPTALCPRGEDRAAPAAGPREPPRGVRDPGGRRAGAGGLGLAEPDSLGRAAQLGPPAACGGSRAACHHAVQRGGRRAAPTGTVPSLSPLLSAACELACTSGCTCTDQWHGLPRQWRPWPPAMAAGRTDHV